MTTISISPRVRGFTLIELMVIMVIAGILAAVAIPNYSSYIVRTKRGAAKSAVLEGANLLERNRSMNGCYNKTSIAACQSQAAGNDFAFNVTMAPAQRGSYILTGALAAQTFTLSATPCGTSGNCPADNDTTFTDAECGTFTLTEVGARGNTGNSVAVATCWQR